jgi:uncharacterized protein
MAVTRDELLAAVESFHRAVDDAAAELVGRLPGWRPCPGGCADCCVDGLSVFTIEAELIRARHGTLLRSGRPHPRGRCAFLGSDGGCRILAHRPYVCRTHGLPLRWLEEGEAGTLSEQRRICPQSSLPLDPATLPNDVCWAIGPHEARLAELERQLSDSLVRVPLRRLFSPLAR